MLVLTRRDGEKIFIGPDIEIKILKVSGRTVSIGIEAPKDINIYREEVFNRMMDRGQIEINL